MTVWVAAALSKPRDSNLPLALLLYKPRAEMRAHWTKLGTELVLDEFEKWSCTEPEGEYAAICSTQGGNLGEMGVDKAHGHTKLQSCSGNFVALQWIWVSSSSSLPLQPFRCDPSSGNSELFLSPLGFISPFSFPHHYHPSLSYFADLLLVFLPSFFSPHGSILPGSGSKSPLWNICMGFVRKTLGITVTKEP